MADVEKDLIKAETLLAQYEYDKARKKFNDVIKAEPKHPMGYFGKAEASLGMPKIKVDDIIELYQKAVELDPENVYFLTTLGSFCSDVGKFNEAEQFYTKATEIDEENASMYFSEFAISYYLKNTCWHFLHQFYTKATEIDEENASMYFSGNRK